MAIDEAGGRAEARALRLGVTLGLAANVLLAIAKVAVGILGHSQALLADGINSTSDVVYYSVVAIFMRAAHKPPDEEHPYGHRQFESIAALVVGAFVITTGVTIFWDSVNGTFDVLSTGAAAQPVTVMSWVALGVALSTVLVKLGLTWFTGRVGRRMKNIALLALAADHRNDVLSASAASIGILLGRLGYAWVDPLAGALVALFVLKTGVDIVRDTASDLMDTSLERTMRGEIEKLTRGVAGVRGIDEIRAHRFGPYLVLNLTIAIDGTLTVADGDAIASRVESTLVSEIRFVREVHVHYHPPHALVSHGGGERSAG